MSAKDKDVVCPVTKTAELLSDTWTMLIMHFLIEGPKRFCELERALEGISTRTLTIKLKKLVAENMAEKMTDGTYAATAKGKGLRAVENAMRKYQEQYL